MRNFIKVLIPTFGLFQLVNLNKKFLAKVEIKIL